MKSNKPDIALARRIVPVQKAGANAVLTAMFFSRPAFSFVLSLAVGWAAASAVAEDLCRQPSPEEMAKAAGVTLPGIPWHVANIWWDFEKPVEHFTSLEMDVTVDRDVPSGYNLYISPCGIAQINGLQFYGGIQTNINGWAGKESRGRVHRGKGGIFSRWSGDKKTPIGLDLELKSSAAERTVTKISSANATAFVDANDAPDLKEWGDKAGTLCVEWFPKIAALLPSDGFTVPKEVTLCFDPDMKGVAHAAGGKITIAAKYVRAHPGDFGMVVHELTHVVQSYPGGGPGWLVEGIADYIRIVRYEPAAPRPKLDPAKASYKDAYKTTAMFLEWVERQGHAGLVVKLNAALREGSYTDALWGQLTGKSVDEQWKAFVASL